MGGTLLFFFSLLFGLPLTLLFFKRLLLRGCQLLAPHFFLGESGRFTRLPLPLALIGLLLCFFCRRSLSRQFSLSLSFLFFTRFAFGFFFCVAFRFLSRAFFLGATGGLGG